MSHSLEVAASAETHLEYRTVVGTLGRTSSFIFECRMLGLLDLLVGVSDGDFG